MADPCFEPRAAGLEVRTLPLCFAAPVIFNCKMWPYTDLAFASEAFEFPLEGENISSRFESEC